MGHTNQTANYNLPQFVGTDKPSWLGDINDAFAAIDTAIAAAASEATTADGKADALTTTVSGHTTQIGTLQNTVTTQGNTLNTVTSLIGNGTPTTTDQTIIGAINELNAKEGNLSDLTTTDKSSLVAAINEAAQSGGGGGSTTLVHTTADNQTYAAQLTEIKTYYDALSADRKLKAWLLVTDYNVIFTPINTNGIFSMNYGDATTIKSSVLNLATSKRYDYEIAATPTVTINDSSSNTNTGAISLYA